MRVIVVPADTSQPCTTLTVTVETWPDALVRLVGHPAESAIYDRDAVLWLNGDGPGVLPPNRRATAYAFGLSAAAARNGTDPANPPYWLHGTVAVTGPAADDEITGVPARLYALFGIERDEDPAGPRNSP
jgi:hypothetical protein